MANELKLVLKKKWYDMIASGEKKEEYREITPYWRTRIDNITTRLCSIIGDKLPYGCGIMTPMESLYAPVVFYLGYTKNRPSMKFNIEEIKVGTGREEWGAEPGKKYFVIKLGERI